MLTAEEIKELRGVLKGADIWGYGNAKLLRSIERKAPQLVTICPAMKRPPGHERQPYFGAIATKEGRRYLRSLRSARNTQ